MTWHKENGDPFYLQPQNPKTTFPSELVILPIVVWSQIPPKVPTTGWFSNVLGSRPDIGFTVVKLAQQMANPSNDHYQVGLHLCRYFLATHRYQLVYNGLSNELLVAYSDSDWGQDHEHHKSTTGYFTMLAQGITSWLSHKQKSVALSSTEAKYMVLSDYSHQLIWTSNLLSEIGFDIPVSCLYGDNLGSLF